MINEDTVVGPVGLRAPGQRTRNEPQSTYQPVLTYENMDTQQAFIADKQAALIAHIREETAQSEAPQNLADE